MASRTERAFEDAFALGRQNQETVELARRHCLNMEFPENASPAWRCDAHCRTRDRGEVDGRWLAGGSMAAAGATVQPTSCRMP